MRLGKTLVFPHLLKTFLRVTPPRVCLHLPLCWKQWCSERQISTLASCLDIKLWYHSVSMSVSNSQALTQSCSRTWLRPGHRVPWYCNTPMLSVLYKDVPELQKSDWFWTHSCLPLVCRWAVESGLMVEEDNVLQTFPKKAPGCSNQQFQLRPISSFLLPIEQ